ncbi:MAG: hypothetical protein ACM3NQ_10175 [Bacteroidales bacterium]
MKVPGLRARAVAVLAITACLTLAVAAQSPRSTFERARLLDESNQNLGDAIRLYSQVAAQATSDRPLAAQAELRAGVLYQRLGRTAEARAAFEKVVESYADQTEAARLARVRLDATAGKVKAAQTDAFAPMRLLPTGTKLAGAGSVSGDGKKMAVVQSLSNIATYDLDTRSLTPLTHYPPGEHAGGPVWSPSNAELAFAFHAAADGPTREIRAVTLDGTVRVLTRSVETERLSPGDWLKDGSAIVTLQGLKDKTCSVGLVPATGGPYTALSPVTCGDLLTRPVGSPDSRFIAFETGPMGHRNITIIGVDGHPVGTAADHPADDAQPVWSPDGKHLVFMSARNGNWALWATAMDGGHAVGTPFKIRDGMKDAIMLGWSARGLAYTAIEMGSDVFTLDVDPSSGTTTGSPAVVEYQRTGRNFSPTWSPDGKYSAFVSQDAQVDSRRHVVTVAHATGKTQEFLIPTSVFQDIYGPRNLRWFSDGTIGFSGVNDKRQPTVFRLTLATGAWQTAALPEANGPAWDPIDWTADARAFLYVAPGTPQARLVARDFGTAQERDLARVNPTVKSFRVSPDGRSVAYSSFEDDGLFVLDFARNAVRRVTERSGGVTWSADGRRLIVSHSKDNLTRPGSLEMVDLATGRASVVWTAPAGDDDMQLLGQATLSPDGTRLIYNQVFVRIGYWNIAQPVPTPAGTAEKTRAR